MFRSGTTLLARALQAHPNVILASDPFFEFFKYIRNKYYSQKIKGFDPEQPLSDKFLEERGIYTQFIDNFLEIKLSEQDIKKAVPRIARAAAPYSPKIIPFLKKIKMFKQKKAGRVLAELIKLLIQAYPKKNLKLVGFKEVWLEEFIGPLLKLPRFYSLQIIRDPRGVVASNKRDSSGRYPILFLVRQWRKTVAFALRHQGNKKFYQIKFEDLLKNPRRVFQQITKFLKIPYSKNLVDFNQFKDGQGRPWCQNSSFGKTRRFNEESIDKWQKVLGKKEVALIELLCGPEMRYLGYQMTNSVVDYNILFQYRESKKGLAEWIKKYAIELDGQRREEEIVRLFLLKNSILDCSDDLLDNFFIDKKAYAQLKRFY